MQIPEINFLKLLFQEASKKNQSNYKNPFREEHNNLTIQRREAQKSCFDDRFKYILEERQHNYQNQLYITLIYILMLIISFRIFCITLKYKYFIELAVFCLIFSCIKLIVISSRTTPASFDGITIEEALPFC